MAVFTVFFCGTGSNSFDFSNADYHSGELVSTLARRCAGMEFVDWIIVDGPGSGNHQEDEKFVKPGNYSAAMGIAKGWGWTENVAHAVGMVKGKSTWSRTELTELGYRVLKQAGVPIEDALIDFDAMDVILPDRPVTQQALQEAKIKIFRKNKPVTQINAIGWSRGAVTTHMFANALAADPTLSSIPVNIIAVDPVPGTGNFGKVQTSIPGNVKNYVAFYARDERSEGFQPTMATVHPSVKATYYPLPGRHATLVGNAGNYIGGNGSNTFYGPGTVVRMLTEQYLNDWGTSVSKCLNYSEMEMLKCYDGMIGQTRKYLELRKQVYTVRQVGGWGQQHDRNVGVGQDWTSTEFSAVAQLKAPGVFINWHHKQIFDRLGAFRNTNRACFQNLGKMLVTRGRS
jgi:hypothetical protein